MNPDILLLIAVVINALSNTYLLWIDLYEKYFYRWSFEWLIDTYQGTKTHKRLCLIIYNKEFTVGNIHYLHIKYPLKEKK